MGSWVTYGLGTENENLPGFVVLTSGVEIPMQVKAYGAVVFCHLYTRVYNAEVKATGFIYQ
jgi:hypothetical protein